MQENQALSLAPVKTLFLDRDGVINAKMPEGRYVTSWAELHVLPNVAKSIKKLNHAGIRVIVVTNQRGVALGLYTAADVDAIHGTLEQHLGSHGAHLDAFFFCPHDRGQCDCRKPLTGLFQQARVRFPEIEASTSLIIGDSLSDIQFGQRLGMKTVFIDDDSPTQKPGATQARILANLCCKSLAEAVDLVLQSTQSRIVESEK